MNPDWEILADNLRSELQAYGGLLQLFSEQQENLLRGDPDAVLSYAHEIEAQLRITADVREQRENVVRTFAAAQGQPADTSLRKLLGFFPEPVRPMLGALIDEINHLIRRVRRGVQRNHQILTRVVQVHQDTIRTLRPSSFTQTYSTDGTLRVTGSNPAWQAAG
jgi:flagellar biosynthesis/type III secretory pathway chaperone